MLTLTLKTINPKHWHESGAKREAIPGQAPAVIITRSNNWTTRLGTDSRHKSLNSDLCLPFPAFNCFTAEHWLCALGCVHKKHNSKQAGITRTANCVTASYSVVSVFSLFYIRQFILN